MKKWFLLPMALIMLAGCDYSHKEEQHGLFYTIFVKPMDALLHFLGHTFNENYGLAIIVIVFIFAFNTDATHVYSSKKYSCYSWQKQMS